MGQMPTWYVGGRTEKICVRCGAIRSLRGIK
jgi:hypothetical protein